MRVTNALFYQNAKNDYQKSMKGLYDTNAQLASGLKIQNSFEDSGIFVDTMRLNYEVASLEQIKETTSKAQTFANNTDKTLNQFTSSLDQFKSKLLQASNEVHSETSLNALANELESIKKHLLSLANTSINGQYLFSGTAFSTKPISNDGSYNGNNENIEALIGSGVQLPYNISGQELFLGKDNDYQKIVSTNASMFNQTKLHPEVMTNDGSASEEVYLSVDDTIRDMVGDSDSDSTNDPDAVFYVSGKNTNGETFSSEIQISSSSKVSDLLESIGKAFGNTSTNQVVEVSMNVHGQIEVKDLTYGNAQLDFHLFGAVDRSAAAGTVGNASQSDIDNLNSQNNVDIISFNKSNFLNQNTTSTIVSRADIYNSGLFKVGHELNLSDGSEAKATTLLHDVVGSDVLELEINGNFYAVDGTTTVADLLTNIETEYPGVSARIENGQILVDQGTFVGALSVSITARDTTNPPLDGSGNLVNAFATSDATNYTRRGFEKDGNELLGNISQIIKSNNAFATSATKLIDVAGVSTFDADTAVTTDDNQLLLNGVDRNGNTFNMQIDLTNTASGSTFSLDGGVTNYTILNADGDPTKADEMTYQQLLDIVSVATSGTSPQAPIATTNAAAIATAIATPTPANLALATAGSTSKEVEEHILDAINYAIAGDATKSAESLKQANLAQYGDIMQTAQHNVEVTLDYRGRIKVLDTTKSESNIEFSMYDKNADSATTAPSLSFMANNSVTIEEPYVDFFSDLDEMIEAVRTGNFRMDAESGDPRNIGIQNSLLKIDHIADHVTKQHTIIGSYSNAMKSANERAELLSVNVQTVRTEVVGVDLAESYLKFQQLASSYQAMLSTVSKINSMSLLQYM